MFYCAIGQHVTEPGVSSVRIPTVIRIVLNEHVVKDPVYENRERVVHTSIGRETVEEVKCCPEHELLGQANGLCATVIGSEKEPAMVRRHVTIGRPWRLRRRD